MTWDARQVVGERSSSSFGSWLGGRLMEAFAIDRRKLWGEGADLSAFGVEAGVPVSQESALRLSVVYRCVRLLSETLAALPADAVRKRGEIREPVPRPPAWLEIPNPEQTWLEFAEQVVESLAMDGNAFVLIGARDSYAFPSELWALHPSRVTVERYGGEITFVVDGSTRLSRYGPTNPGGDVLHVKLASNGGLRGLSPIMQAAQAIGLAVVSEKFGSRFFARGQALSGVIQLPAAAPAISKEHVDLIRDAWKAAHAGSDRSFEPGILTGGATWERIAITPEEAQFLETRRFQAEEIASRIYGIPPHMVGLVEKSTSWGTGIEQQSLGFVRFTLLPWIVRFESAFSTLLPRGQFVRLNQRALVRADSQTEANVLNRQLMAGVINRNEYRALYDLPPVPGGDRYMIPLNMTLLGPGGTAAEPAPSDEPTDAGVGGEVTGEGT